MNLRIKTLIQDLDARISNMVASIEIAPDVSSLAHSLNEIKIQRKELVLELEKLKERLVSLKGKGSFEVDIMGFPILIQWAVFTNLEDNDRDKIRKIIDSLIEYIIVDKTDECITIKIKYYGNDELLAFAGVNRKPHWRFDNDFHSDTKEVTTFLENEIENVPEHRKAVEQLHKLKEGYVAMYDAAVDMLSEVGYPKIDGQQFWPYTGKYEKAVVKYEGTEYKISTKGRLPNAITIALETTGLTRQQFIDKYRVDKDA